MLHFFFVLIFVFVLICPCFVFDDGMAVMSESPVQPSSYKHAILRTYDIYLDATLCFPFLFVCVAGSDIS